uniref:Uncharacterized protein n=1 Tax=Cryptococcus bacillisporus CA1280 TaxID=1296109 RepID=A0A0D0VM01_CRYGA|nr:hypothetical protein I312_02210 [Cryptococcus bacillisporus CA1280]
MNPRRCSSPTLPTPRSRCSSCAPAAQTASSPAPRRPAGPSTSTTSSSSTQTHTRATTHTPSGSSSPAGSAERPMTARTAAASPGGISRTSTACRSQPRAGAAAGIYVRASAASLPYALTRYTNKQSSREFTPVFSNGSDPVASSHRLASPSSPPSFATKRETTAMRMTRRMKTPKTISMEATEVSSYPKRS